MGLGWYLVLMRWRYLPSHPPHRTTRTPSISALSRPSTSSAISTCEPSPLVRIFLSVSLQKRLNYSSTTRTFTRIQRRVVTKIKRLARRKIKMRVTTTVQPNSWVMKMCSRVSRTLITYFAAWQCRNCRCCPTTTFRKSLIGSIRSSRKSLRSRRWRTRCLPSLSGMASSTSMADWSEDKYCEAVLVLYDSRGIRKHA